MVGFKTRKRDGRVFPIRDSSSKTQVKPVIIKSSLDVFDRNQLKVARQVVNMPDAAVPFSGAGISKSEARDIIKRLGSHGGQKTRLGSDVVDSKGFSIVKGKTPDTKFIFDKKGVSVHESFIPQTKTTSARVFFVSGSGGDEFGQFASKGKALSRARQLSRLSVSDRKRFDV